MDITNSKNPDTLVLKIVERDCITNKVDTSLYLIFDSVTQCFIIRGYRNETTNKRNDQIYYSFECGSIQGMIDFIQFVIDDENQCSFMLYNHTNLPASANEITYDFLVNTTDDYSEISGYNFKTLPSRKKLFHIVRMLKNVYNEY